MSASESNIIPLMNSAGYRRLRQSQREFLFEEGTDLSEDGKRFLASLDNLSENYKGDDEEFKGKQIILVEKILEKLCKDSVTKAMLLLETDYLTYGEGNLGGLRIHHRGYQSWYALTDRGRAAIGSLCPCSL